MHAVDEIEDALREAVEGLRALDPRASDSIIALHTLLDRNRGTVYDAATRLRTLHAEGLILNGRVHGREGQPLSLAEVLQHGRDILLDSLLTEALGLLASGGDVEAWIASTARGLHRELFEDPRVSVWTGPLVGFGAPEGFRIRLDEGVLLREGTPEELEQLEPGKNDVLALDVFDFAQTKWVVEMTFKRPRANREPDSGHVVAERVLTLLRIFQEGSVAVPSLWSRGLHGTMATGSPARAFGARYALSPAEVEPFSALATWAWPALGQAMPPALALAYRRFAHAIERSSPDDALIDHAIALEALVMPGVKQENRFRFSMRVATLVSRTEEERVTAFETARRIYDARSDIVHGSARSPTAAAELHRTGEALARRALRTALPLAISSDKDHARTMDRLDEALLRGVPAASVIAFLRDRERP